MSGVIKKCKKCGKEYAIKPSRADKSSYCSRKCQWDDFKEKFKGDNNPHWKGGNLIKQCQYCGKDFYVIPARGNIAIYCSNECRIRVQQTKNKKCPNCGSQIPPQNTTYCSRKCMIEHVLKQKISSGAKTTSCLICGKQIPVKRIGDAKYCSRKCYDLSRQQKVKKKCDICGKVFLIHSCRDKKGKKYYCSMECRNKGISKRQIGNKSHFWKGGLVEGRRRLRDHPLYKEWRKKVFELDNYTCWLCGTKSKKLTAHHLIPVCVNPRKALRVSNGITLCWWCHQRLHKEIGTKRGMYEMQKIKESDIKRAIKDYLRLKGFFVFYILQGLGSHRGVPDIIAVGPPNGRTLFIEVKTEKGKQSKHQSDFQREIESHGGTYILARSIEDVERVIRDAG